MLQREDRPLPTILVFIKNSHRQGCSELYREQPDDELPAQRGNYSRSYGCGLDYSNNLEAMVTAGPIGHTLVI